MRTPEQLAILANNRNDRTIDVFVDNGITGRNPAENYQALQNCVDVCSLTPARVKLTRDLVLWRPIRVPTGTYIDGKGFGRLIFSSHGLTTISNKKPLTKENFLKGLIPNTFSFALKGELTIVELGGLFSNIAETTNDLTLEFAFNCPLNKGVAIGWSERGTGYPIACSIDPTNSSILVFIGENSFTVYDPSLKPSQLNETTIQIGEKQALIIINGKGQLFPLPYPIPFAQRHPFKIGGMATGPNVLYSDYVTIPQQDAVVFGCLLAPYLRYQWNTTPTRRDGREINYQNTYFSSTQGDVYLQLDDKQSEVIDTRTLYNYNGQTGTVFILGQEHADIWNSFGNIKIKGLTVEATCDAFAIGLGLAIQIVDCNFASGVGYAIGGQRFGANYGNRIRHSSLTGRAGAFYCDYGMWDLFDIRWDVTGRNGIYTRNTKLTLQHLFVGGNTFGGTKTGFRFQGGGAFIKDINIDIEDGQSPTEALFHISTRTDADNSTGFLGDFNIINFGALPSSTPLWWLENQTDSKGFVSINNPMTSGGGKRGNPAIVYDDRSKWVINANLETLGPPEKWPILSSESYKQSFPNASLNL